MSVLTHVPLQTLIDMEREVVSEIARSNGLAELDSLSRQLNAINAEIDRRSKEKKK